MRLRKRYIVSPPTSALSSQQSTNNSHLPIPATSGSTPTDTQPNSTADADVTASDTVTAPINQPVENRTTTNGSTSVPVSDAGSVGAGPDEEGQSDAQAEGGAQPVTPVPKDTPTGDTPTVDTGDVEEDAIMVEENNRDVPVVCAVTQRVYPAPSRFDNVDFLSDDELIGRAPWFDRAALEQEAIVQRYATDGWLPGGVPLDATTSWCWRNQFASFDRYFIVGYDRTLVGVRAEFARKC